jgi:hypothetical protein
VRLPPITIAFFVEANEGKRAEMMRQIGLMLLAIGVMLPPATAALGTTAPTAASVASTQTVTNLLALSPCCWKLSLAGGHAPDGTDCQADLTSGSADPSGTVGSQDLLRSSHTFLSLIYDPGLTMRSGVENVLSVHNGIAWAEDRLIGTRWFSEEGLPRKTGGVMCRFEKYFLLDRPVDYISRVFAHEFYGHGARVREFDFKRVGYSFGLPPPYGEGGGSTTFYFTSRLVSNHEMLAIRAAGLGVESLIEQALGLRWLQRAEINYREASIYLESFVGSFDYIQGTKEILAANQDGHDIVGYLRLINRHAGRNDDSNLLMNVDDLKTRNLINLADPFLVYSLVACFKTYLWAGGTSTALPVVHIKGLDYLPSFRMGLTPFGPEYHMENFFRIGDKVLLADLRIGDQTFYTSWGGIGVLARNICASKRLSLDMNLDLWRQPEIEIGGESITSKGGGLGGAFSVRGRYDLTDSRHPISALIELGYKSPGFLEGYALDSSPILMVGMAFKE